MPKKAALTRLLEAVDEAWRNGRPLPMLVAIEFGAPGAIEKAWRGSRDPAALLGILAVANRREAGRLAAGLARPFAMELRGTDLWPLAERGLACADGQSSFGECRDAVTDIGKAICKSEYTRPYQILELTQEASIIASIGSTYAARTSVRGLAMLAAPRDLSWSGSAEFERLLPALAVTIRKHAKAPTWQAIATGAAGRPSWEQFTAKNNPRGRRPLRRAR